MEHVEDVLKARDKLTDEEAEEETSGIRSTIWDMLGNGADYDDIEEMLMDDYGLEMDYIMDLV